MDDNIFLKNNISWSHTVVKVYCCHKAITQTPGLISVNLHRPVATSLWDSWLDFGGQCQLWYLRPSSGCGWSPRSVALLFFFVSDSYSTTYCHPQSSDEIVKWVLLRTAWNAHSLLPFLKSYGWVKLRVAIHAVTGSMALACLFRMDGLRCVTVWIVYSIH